LNLLAGAISDETMQRLNYEVDENKRSPKEVAREFLAEKGF
jgi:osmoprotectant transport system permease protein